MSSKFEKRCCKDEMVLNTRTFYLVVDDAEQYARLKEVIRARREFMQKIMGRASHG
jgi:hypothetical protein